MDGDIERCHWKAVGDIARAAACIPACCCTTTAALLDARTGESTRTGGRASEDDDAGVEGRTLKPGDSSRGLAGKQ